MQSIRKKTHQHAFWDGIFAKGYVARNYWDVATLDRVTKKDFGVSRTIMNGEFLRDIPKSASILEVGCNVGNNLLHLRKMGYTNLYAMEIHQQAVVEAKKRIPRAQIIQGDALDIPFKDGYFDLVFTSGVLIHIAPKNRKKVMSEIYRVSNKYIWGFEYFAEKSTEIPYRGNRNVLWKAPFSELYRQTFPDLKLVRERKYKYKDNDNEDIMFLLRK